MSKHEKSDPPTVTIKEHDFASKLPPEFDARHDDHSSDSDSHSDSNTTATNSSDEFDWDEDEEKKKNGPERKGAKRGRALYLALMRLSRPVRVFLLGALGAGVLVTPLLVFNLRFKDSPARPQAHIWSLWLTVTWSAACGTYLLVDSIPRIVITLTYLFGGQVERSKLQIELTMAVSAWLKLALDISWMWISLSVIRAFYKPPQGYWTIVNRVMQALFSVGIILLVEKLFLQFVAINFHQKALADRLAENQLGLKALDRLSNAQPATPRTRGPYRRGGHRSANPSFELTQVFKEQGTHAGSPTHDTRKSTVSVSGSRDLGHSPTGNSRAGSPTREHKHRRRGRKNPKKMMASIIVDHVGGAIGQVALKDSKFNKASDYSGLVSARKLARKLFSALSNVSPPRSHLIVQDFEPYFRTTAEAHDAFRVFDKDGNGDISKREMREAVQRIYRERRSLVASLKDAGSAVAKLDAVLLTVALVLIIFVCLLIFSRKNTLASLVPMATIILGFSFVFGHSAQTLFESLIFIFSTHVFDVGDLVMIDDQILFVREFGLFSTTFRRVDGQEIIAPNALLASSKLVHNLRRSNSMWETTKLVVSYSTPLEVIEELKARINAYVTENNREWSNFALNIEKMEYQNAIHLLVAMEHRPNWQDWGGRWARRTAFMRNLKTLLEELDVQYTMPVQPVILPRAAPFSAPNPPAPPRPSSSIHGTSRDDLGNAGTFSSSNEDNRAPGRSFRPGVGTF